MLEKNERYAYTAVGHPALRNASGEFYCRALRIRMKDYIFCKDCPLFGGMVQGENRSPECFYYDLDLSDASEIEPEALEKREHALMEAGLLPLFPAFLIGGEAERRFGILERAIQFAARAHSGQMRKGTGLPYICHPMEVMMLTARMTNDTEVAAAAALHDTLEDTDTTEEEIRSAFGDRVLSLVQGESENKRPGIPKAESWQIRKEEALKKAAQGSREEKIIMLADKLSNARSTSRSYAKIGDRVFERFNEKRKERHAWYAHGCLEVLKELSDTPQYQEYERLIREIYGDP